MNSSKLRWLVTLCLRMTATLRVSQSIVRLVAELQKWAPAFKVAKNKHFTMTPETKGEVPVNATHASVILAVFG